MYFVRKHMMQKKKNTLRFVSVIELLELFYVQMQ